jgi:hypothetical protein
VVEKARTLLFLFLILTILLSCNPVILSQNAPVTTAGTIGGALPGTVTVPVTVTNFNNIGAISLSLDYNNSVLQFLQGTPNPQVPSLTTIDNDLGNGYHRLVMGWFGSGISLANGSTIMTLSFTYISGVTTLAWFDNGPSCEYADGNYYVLNDIPQSTYYINGYVCGVIGNPGPITGDNSVCEGQQGVSYSIAPIINATSYNWTVPAGAVIAGGGNTSSIVVDYPVGTLSGLVSVYAVSPCGNGPPSQLPVTLNTLPVADAGNDFPIPYGTSTTLYAASGGSGSFSYHWSPEALLLNPDVQNPQTVVLYNTTVFSLLVTNLTTLCHNNDEVVVTITGGPLTLNPIAIPGEICAGQTSQLFSNAGGGSGNYTYQWTSNPPGTPPWNSNLEDPQVSPDVSTQYFISVFDGFNTVSGSTYVTVNQLPAATISGGASLCDDGSTTTLTIDLTGSPPWSFIYSDGVNSFNVSGQMTTPYLIVTSDPGNYTVLFVQDANCTGVSNGSATVTVSPVPATPVISQNGFELISSSCCGNQWFLDGVAIPGAINQTYTPVLIGTYFDIVTINGCSSDTSNTIIVTIISIDEKKSEHIYFYPNPAINWIKLLCTGQNCRNIHIRIMNSFGKPVKEFYPDKMSQVNELQLFIGDLMPGFYFVKFLDEKESYIIKLVIQ